VEELGPRLTPSVTFAAQQTFALGNTPYGMAEGDFNGDGRADLVSTNDLGNSVSVLLNNPTVGAANPSFAAQKTFAAGNGPVGVAVADFNGDGRPDLVVANWHNGTGNTASVLLNTTPAGAATPSFGAFQSFAVGSAPFGLAVGDFNGDGRPDFAVANSDSNTVSVFLNTTPAGATIVSFAAQRTFAVGSLPRGVAVGDFNGDGRTDLAVANDNSNAVSVLLNTTPAGASTPSFAAQQNFAAGIDAKAVAVGDVNGDGRADLAVANSGANTVSVLLNTTAAGAGTASFAAQRTFPIDGHAEYVAVGDFDGDGRTDLAVTDMGNNKEAVLLNTTTFGASSPSFAQAQAFNVWNMPGGVAAGDFNGDGRTDLAVANYLNNNVSVLSNTTAAFPVATPVVVGQADTQGLWVYNRTVNNWLPLTAANASLIATNSQGDVVGEFPGYGIRAFRFTVGWVPLHPVDATALAMDANGDVVASFPGYGVGEYLPSAGWKTLTKSVATLLAMDANGDVVGEFPGYGIQL
jgi:hypothetical protein